MTSCMDLLNEKYDVGFKALNGGRLENYKDLANAIIVNAVADYRRARRHLAKYDTKKIEMNRIISECEIFFKSEWFKLLTNLDGEQLLEELQREELE